MDFSAALTALKAGKRVQRAGMAPHGIRIALQTPDALSKMKLPYLYMTTASGEPVPWTAPQSDLLAEDWSIAE